MYYIFIEYLIRMIYFFFTDGIPFIPEYESRIINYTFVLLNSHSSNVTQNTVLQKYRLTAFHTFHTFLKFFVLFFLSCIAGTSSHFSRRRYHTHMMCVCSILNMNILFTWNA